MCKIVNFNNNLNTEKNGHLYWFIYHILQTTHSLPKSSKSYLKMVEGKKNIAHPMKKTVPKVESRSSSVKSHQYNFRRKLYLLELGITEFSMVYGIEWPGKIIFIVVIVATS